MTINFINQAIENGDSYMLDQRDPRHGDVVLVEIDFDRHWVCEFRRLSIDGCDRTFESDQGEPVTRPIWEQDITWRIKGRFAGIRSGHPERIEP